MTSKHKKAKAKKKRSRKGTIGRIFAAVPLEDELLEIAEGDAGSELWWNRPRKKKVSLRLDYEVLDWFKAKGPGYQTRINRILRRVMEEGKGKR
jgi:uncharacterized protein (DUF4415 family)